MGYSILENGNFQTHSRLQEDFDIDLVLQLQKPDGRKFTIGDGIEINLDNINNDQDIIDTINNVLNYKGDKIKFKFTKPYKELFITQRDFIKYINKHSTTKLTNVAKDAALKNVTLDGILKVTSDPQNLLNLSVPINMDDQQTAKANSILGKDELYVTADNPGTKYMMQEQNMVGKQVIGITAVSLKTFFAASTYFNLKLNELKKAIMLDNDVKIFETLDSLIIQNKFKFEQDKDRITTIANLNYDLILDVLKGKTNTTFILSEEELNKYPDLTKAISLINSSNTIIDNNKVLELDVFIQHLAEISSRSDASLAISGLLSSATDLCSER